MAKATTQMTFFLTERVRTDPWPRAGVSERAGVSVPLWGLTVRCCQVLGLKFEVVARRSKVPIRLMSAWWARGCEWALQVPRRVPFGLGMPWAGTVRTQPGTFQGHVDAHRPCQCVGVMVAPVRLPMGRASVGRGGRNHQAGSPQAAQGGRAGTTGRVFPPPRGRDGGDLDPGHRRSCRVGRRRECSSLLSWLVTGHGPRGALVALLQCPARAQSHRPGERTGRSALGGRNWSLTSRLPSELRRAGCSGTDPGGRPHGGQDPGVPGVGGAAGVVCGRRHEA